MSEERKTYASEAEIYQLDPAKIFEVVADVNIYLHSAVSQAQEDNPNHSRPISRLRGKGRTLNLETEAVIEPGFFAGFNLAELVLATDNSELTLKVNEHQEIVIPSYGLHHIGIKYALEK